MRSGRVQEAASRGGDLLQRLQGMLYEYHALGCFDEARPHILWLMEIAQKRSAEQVSHPV